MTATARREPAQAEVDTRALELASGADAVLQHHLVECRDRYLSLDGKIDKLNTLLFRGLAALVSALIAVLGYLAVHGTAPLIR